MSVLNVTWRGRGNGPKGGRRGVEAPRNRKRARQGRCGAPYRTTMSRYLPRAPSLSAAASVISGFRKSTPMARVIQ